MDEAPSCGCLENLGLGEDKLAIGDKLAGVGVTCLHFSGSSCHCERSSPGLRWAVTENQRWKRRRRKEIARYDRKAAQTRCGNRAQDEARGCPSAWFCVR